jgi:tyrosinase
VRAPTPENAEAQSNNTLVAITLDANAQSFQTRLYNIFASVSNFGQFANEAWTGANGSSFDSIEALHDTIHTLSGLQGHMAFIPFSAFDPIFWLHHAMVDRAFAMWQTLYPGSWITPTAAAMNSYTTSTGQIQDSQSPLTPFYSGPNGSFWSSDMVRNTSVFAYTYPEISGLGGPEGRTQVIRAINRLYGAASPANMARQRVRNVVRTDGLGSTGGIAKEGVTVEPSTQDDDDDGNEAALSRVVTDNQYREWVANIRVNKQALNASFLIHLHLGDKASNAKSALHGNDLIGTMGVFASPPSFANHMVSSHRMSGAIPLTGALIERVRSGVLQNLDVQSVTPFLKDRLRLEVSSADGSPVVPAAVQGLRVSIASANVNVADRDDQLPQWGPMVHQFDYI